MPKDSNATSIRACFVHRCDRIRTMLDRDVDQSGFVVSLLAIHIAALGSTYVPASSPGTRASRLFASPITNNQFMQALNPLDQPGREPLSPSDALASAPSSDRSRATCCARIPHMRLAISGRSCRMGVSASLLKQQIDTAVIARSVPSDFAPARIADCPTESPGDNLRSSTSRPSAQQIVLPRHERRSEAPDALPCRPALNRQ